MTAIGGPSRGDGRVFKRVRDYQGRNLSHCVLECVGVCEENFIDNQYGEWFRTIDKNGRVTRAEKVEIWKCPYHNSRACFEVKRRLEAIIESEYQYPS